MSKSSHILPQTQTEEKTEEGKGYTTWKPTTNDRLSLAKLHHPKQYHQLVVKCSNTQAHGGHSPSNRHIPFPGPHSLMAISKHKMYLVQLRSPQSLSQFQHGLKSQSLLILKCLGDSSDQLLLLLVECKLLLSWGRLYPVCSFLLLTSHGSGINVLGVSNTIQASFSQLCIMASLDLYTSNPLPHDWPFLNQGGGFHNLFTAVSFMTLTMWPKLPSSASCLGGNLVLSFLGLH